MPDQQQEQRRVVLNPQPLFNGTQLMETKVFAGETLSELVERSAEAREKCGIQEGGQLSEFSVEVKLPDGMMTQFGLDQALEPGGDYVIAPSGIHA